MIGRQRLRQTEFDCRVDLALTIIALFRSSAHTSRAKECAIRVLGSLSDCLVTGRRPGEMLLLLANRVQPGSAIFAGIGALFAAPT